MPAVGGLPDIRFQRLENGETLIELEVDQRVVSRLYIIPLTIAIGVARVRVDGIGGVETEEEYRGRGYARRLMDAALTRMRGEVTTASPDLAALSFLFGISNFYEKFGYVPAGPWVSLHLLELASSDPVPRDWTIRQCAPADLSTIHALYQRGAASSVAAVIRQPAGRVWSTLAEVASDPNRDECRVVADPTGKVAAYAWRGRDFWPVDEVEAAPDALVIGEVMADGPDAADAVIAACRAWAVEESVHRPQIARVQISLTPENRIYAAAMRQEAKLEISWTPSGGFMARTLDVGRLLAALAPELSKRLQASSNTDTGTLQLVTDIGDAALVISPGAVAVKRSDEASGERYFAPALHLSQQDLTRLAFGAFPVGDLLDRLANPPDVRVRRWLKILFPRQHPFPHLPDWV